MMKFWICVIICTSVFGTSAGAEPLDVFKDCDACPEMIELPMGEFIMGAPDDEFRNNIAFVDDKMVSSSPEHPPYVRQNEGPQHKVTVDIRFAMGKNEITYGEWMACVDDGGCNGYIPRGKVLQSGTDAAVIRTLTDTRFSHLASEENIARTVSHGWAFEISGQYPVVHVSYVDAQSYVAWLNTKLGTDAYRLPTEAEWEYAARSGTTTRFAQGFEPTTDQVNIAGELTEAMLQQKRPDLRNLGYPVPVDELDAANAWGLRHMSGNVSEITQSCYKLRYVGWSTTREWLKNGAGESCERAYRGGNYFGPMDAARVAWRALVKETGRRGTNGFRVVKELRDE